jgi:hypothetical protein
VRNTYAGFGLELDSAFTLPGMDPGPAGTSAAPRLVLELETAAQIDSSWSGPASPRPWRGELGDGQSFSVQWGVGGDLRFSYGERALFQLDSAAGKLSCVPFEASELDWMRVLITRVLPNVSLARGREALHASAVETPRGVVAVAAPSGMGKSTLASELLRRGWTWFADDSVVLERGEEGVVAHPGTPHATLSAGSPEPASEGLGRALAELDEGERWIAVRDACTKPSGVAAVVLLERAQGAGLAVKLLEPSPLALAPFMLGLPDEPSRRAAARFALYSDLVESASLLKLTGDTATPPENLADALEGALDLSSPSIAGGVK